MKRIRITQIKSGIDRNETAKRTLVALGLKKLNSSVEVEATPQVLGMVRRVTHLLKVEELEATFSSDLHTEEIEQTESVPAGDVEAVAS